MNVNSNILGNKKVYSGKLTVDIGCIKYIVLLVPLFEPNLFVKYNIMNYAFIGGLLLVAELVFLLVVSKRLQISNMFLAVFFYRISFFFQTVINGGDLMKWGYYSIVIMVMCVLFDNFIRKDARRFLSALLFILTLQLLINSIVVILFPSGITNGIYFVGKRTRFTDVIFPTILISLILDKMDNRKISLRTKAICVLCLFNIISKWIGTALVGLGIVVIIYLLLKNKKRLINFLTISKITIGAIILNILIAVCRIQNIFSWLIVDILHKDLSLTYRTYIWDEIFKYMQGNWLLGFGMVDNGNFVYWGKSTWAKELIWQAHNQWLQLFHDGGLLLVFSFIIMLLFAGRQLKSNRVNIQIKLYLVCFYLSYMIMMITEIYSYMSYFYIIIFLIYNSKYLSNETEARE
jgi:O-antigen ligase